MAAKALMPNQCTPLHFIYGVRDCCLCHSNVERDLLKEDLKYLLQFVDEDFVGSDQLEYFRTRMELIRQRIK